MGVVYRAEDTRLDRSVALKFLPPELGDDDDSRQRFIREAKAASALDHPNICTIYDIGEVDGRTYMAMAHYRGETLKQRLQRGRLEPDDSVAIVGKVAAGLAAAHDRGILHRDIKPANVFLTDDGQVKILDFGLAKVESDPQCLTRTGSSIGTPAYMSPEQTRGQSLDARTDLWSLGVVFFELLSGQQPFTAANVLALIHAIHTSPPASLSRLRPDVPAPLVEIVDKLMAKDRDRRYASCRELLADLERLDRGAEARRITPSPPLDLEPTEVMDAQPSAVAPAANRRLRWPLAVFGAIAALLAIVAVTSLLRSHDRDAVPVQGADGEKPSVAVLFFDNRTGDPELDWLRTGLADMLVTDLSQSLGLRVLPTSRMYQILEELDLLDGSLSFTMVEDVAARAAVDRVILGSVTRAGETLRIDVKVQDTASAEILASKQASGQGEESLFSLIDDLSLGIRQDFELPDAGPELEIASVTTSSIEAYRHYAEGMRRHLAREEEAAIPLFRQAVEIDPEFAMAWAGLAVVHGNLRRIEALEYAARAREHVERLTPFERHYVEGIYHGYSYHGWPRAIAAWERAIVAAPDQSSAYHNLAEILIRVERYEEAVDLIERRIRQGSTSAGEYQLAADAYAGLGELDTALDLLERAAGESAEDPMIHQSFGWLFLRAGDPERGAQELAKSWSLRPQAFTLLGLCASHLLRDDWRGALALGERHAGSPYPAIVPFAARCRQLAMQLSGRPTAALAILDEMIAAAPADRFRALYRTQAIRLLFLLGRYQEMLSQAEIARREGAGLLPDNLALFYSVRVAILRRHPGAGERIEEFAALARELGFAIEARYHRRLLAELALAEGDPATAIAELEQAAATLPAHGVFRLLHWPDHVPLWDSLAQAHLAAGDTDRAAEVWRRIASATDARLEHSSLYVRSLYRLADHHRRRGEVLEAADYYRRFLVCWQDGELERGWVGEAQRFLAGTAQLDLLD